MVWETGRSLWFNSRDRVTENLSPKERRDFAEIVRQRRGRPWNLDEKERRRFVGAIVQREIGCKHSGERYHHGPLGAVRQARDEE